MKIVGSPPEEFTQACAQFLGPQMPRSTASAPRAASGLCRPPESRPRDEGVAVTACGGLGRTEQTECGVRGWRAGLWGRQQQGRVGQAGLGVGWDAPFWVIAPERLPSPCRSEGSRPLTSPGWNGKGRQPPTALGARLPGLRSLGDIEDPGTVQSRWAGFSAPYPPSWSGERCSGFCWLGAGGELQCL